MARKDEVEYGAKIGRIDQATRMLADTEELANWAEQQLSALFPGLTSSITESTDRE